MKQSKLKDLISTHEIELDYAFSSPYHNPLPNRISLYVDNDKDSIDVSLEDDILEAEIYIGQLKANLTDNNINYLYNYFSEKLAEKIQETKKYYEAEKYENNINELYIR